MKRILVVLMFAVAVMLSPLAVAGAAQAQQGGLSGTWHSVDVVDGSDQVLSIVGSDRHVYSVFLYDTVASVCGGAPTKVVGTGALEGDTLVTVGTLACKPGGNILRQRIEIDYAYDAASDTLTDEFGSVWTR